MTSNRFFATTVHIKEKRGHQVVSAGPYRFVRYKGYAGSVVYTLLIALIPGSFCTFISALFTIGLIVARTSLEEQTLQVEL
jgi:protein-S-isoprenylcysteine O-methyltransferase Ste14